MPQDFARKYPHVAAVSREGKLVIDMEPFADAIQGGRLKEIDLGPSGQGVAIGPKFQGVRIPSHAVVPGASRLITNTTS